MCPRLSQNWLDSRGCLYILTAGITGMYCQAWFYGFYGCFLRAGQVLSCVPSSSFALWS